jgi:hypothetical protein
VADTIEGDGQWVLGTSIYEGVTLQRGVRSDWFVFLEKKKILRRVFPPLHLPPKLRL